eukprot:CAMPEP_0202904192 /NCGR_PEP_ID=MMETSP1392-20130828/28276_1 /ASSEMBLY_ACC=CAM_ASM_000868 /TAXON_ID=225041 /ORGANISM="Chlamydomonas chlamydogama, Strain SAG 11-48b" /LENGTH=409 /DNA_ID=CAMNT_0049591711 /DNA_START=191 /DNA_END=1417 /DNA_ORIENTATION=+
MGHPRDGGGYGTGTLSKDTSRSSGSQGSRRKDNKVLKKAGALGFETRNVANYWLQPLSLRGSVDAPAPAPDTAGQTQTSIHYSTADFVQLSPNYGPGQSTPKELAAMRTVRTLQNLGRTAIYSSSPYIDTALETLIPSPGASPYMLSPQAAERRLHGKLPRRGSKAAALRRAKRLVGENAAFKSEVPFADALRVCNLGGDKTAMPALLKAYIFDKPKLPPSKLEYYSEVLAMQPPVIQLQAVAQLLQNGYFFTAIKVVYNDYELLHATLEEMKLVVQQGVEESDWEVAALTWIWKDGDKEVFLKQFRDLRIIAYYMDVRRQLRALKAQGAVALARVEREMLLKVITDFMHQLEEDAAAHAAEAAVKKAEEDAAAAVTAEKRKAEEAVRTEAEAKARAAARAKAAAEKRR